MTQSCCHRFPFWSFSELFCFVAYHLYKRSMEWYFNLMSVLLVLFGRHENLHTNSKQFSGRNQSAFRISQISLFAWSCLKFDENRPKYNWCMLTTIQSPIYYAAFPFLLPCYLWKTKALFRVPVAWTLHRTVLSKIHASVSTYV